MSENFDLIMIILALVFFGFGAFNAIAKINPTCAGLFCLTLTLLT